MRKPYGRDKPPEIPKEIANCPVCGGQLKINDILEWEPETGYVTEAGLYINCSNKQEHFINDYGGWVRVGKIVLAWLNSHYVLAKYSHAAELDRLKKWNESARQFAGCDK